jgi:hypothetical protein
MLENVSEDCSLFDGFGMVNKVLRTLWILWIRDV